MNIPFRNISQRKKLQAYSSAQIVFVIILLVVINVLLFPFSFRIDLTQDKMFTLSDVSKQSVKDANDAITIHAYMSEEIPPELITIKQETVDLLNEYKKISSDVHIDIKDPKKDENALKQAQDYAIPEIQFSLLKSDQFQVSTGYMGLVIQFHDSVETIPVIQSNTNLEYEITSSILKMTRDNNPVIAFANGHDELDSSVLEQVLGRTYTAQQTDLTSGEPIPAEVTTLVLLGSRTEFTDKELYVVDQFIMRGGKVLLYTDPVLVDQNLQTTDNPSRISELLAHYGLNVQKNIILDPVSFETLRFNTGNGFAIMQQYPVWPRILKENFNPDNPATGPLESLVLGWPSGMEPTNPAAQDVQYTSFAQTTPQSWALNEPYLLGPDQMPSSPTSEQKSFSVAGELQGKMTSFFTGKDLPEGSENFISATDSGTIIVVADSDGLSESALQSYPENAVFAANMIDVLSQDSDLITIRSRQIGNRPLNPLEDQEKTLIRYLNIFASVVMVVIVGFGALAWRKKQDTKALELYK